VTPRRRLRAEACVEHRPTGGDRRRPGLGKASTMPRLRGTVPRRIRASPSRPPRPSRPPEPAAVSMLPCPTCYCCEPRFRNAAGLFRAAHAAHRMHRLTGTTDSILVVAILVDLCAALTPREGRKPKCGASGHHHRASACSGEFVPARGVWRRSAGFTKCCCEPPHRRGLRTLRRPGPALYRKAGPMPPVSGARGAAWCTPAGGPAEEIGGDAGRVGRRVDGQQHRRAGWLAEVEVLHQVAKQ
jgi:hypothetical protein